MQNILYCFDENYNTQAITSMYSLLENTTKKLNFHIIHKNPGSFEKLLELVSNDESFNNAFLYKFENTDYNFPNVKNSHVSEATYYRMFISDYIPDEFGDILYVDPDVICINPFNETIDEINKELILRKLLIGVRTEHLRNDQNNEMFKRLSVNNKYFNAGVMLINLKLWKENDFKNKLLKKSKLIEDMIKFWDQDVMNSEINGKYLEIPQQLNQHPFEFPGSVVYYQKNTIFLHYSGKNKPWTKKGFPESNSIFYKDFYKDLFGKDFKISRFKK